MKQSEVKILEALEMYRCDGIRGDYVYLRDAVKVLPALIASERKEAVEGFVDRYLVDPNRYKNAISEYLSQEVSEEQKGNL
jgi:hypothetical protein